MTKKGTFVQAEVLALALIGSGCLDMVVPKEGEMTLTLDPQVLDKSSFGTITVLALDELGAPVMDGTQIFITTDLGMVLPFGNYTDGTLPDAQHKVNVNTRRGVAQATFYSGNSRGTAVITVKSGDHTLASSFVVGRTPDVILLSVEGQSEGSGSVLPPEGGAVIVTAYVYDQNDNPIVDEDVVFSTTAGVLESGGGRLRTGIDGTVEDVLTTTHTAQVTGMLPGSATMAGLLSPSLTITVPEPVIYTVVPNTGTYLGGDVVVVSGEAFAFGARVLFDGLEGIPTDPDPTPATWSNNRMEVITPPSPFGSADIVDVTVQNPNNYYSTRESGFTYIEPDAG